MTYSVVNWVRRNKKITRILGAIAIFIFISFTVAQIPTNTLVDWIGSDNAWLLMFVLGAIGGLSTFVTIPYHVVLMSLASAGINPILLGTATALGVMLGDSAMFLLSKQIKKGLSEKHTKRIDSLAHVVKKHPRLLTPGLVAYGMFSPFSNDFIVAGLTLMNFKYLRIIVPLAMGNIVYNIALAYFGLYMYQTIFGG